jgi:transposase
MMREKQFKLERKEVMELERRYKQERDKRVAQRLQCIILLHNGKSAKEAAKILMVSKKTVKRWIKVFVRYGLEGLCSLNYNDSGLKCELSPKQLEELEKYLSEHVRSSAKEVMGYIEREFGIKYSENGVVKLLKRLGYRYKKPAVIPSKASKEKQIAFLEVYEEKKKNLSEGGKVYFIDASHFLHNAIVGYGWIKEGETMEILTNSGRNRFNVLGAYSPGDVDLISIEGTESCDAEMVRNLLIKIREVNLGEVPLIAVMDNVRYQHAKSVKELSEKLNIEILYLPPYSPNLNLIERFWKFMKKKVLKNKYYPKFEEFVTAVRDFLRNVDKYKAELKSLMTEKFQLLNAA